MVIKHLDYATCLTQNTNDRMLENKKLKKVVELMKDDQEHRCCPLSPTVIQ